MRLLEVDGDDSVFCPRCSGKTFKDGHDPNGTQRYRCKSCRYKFRSLDSPGNYTFRHDVLTTISKLGKAKWSLRDIGETVGALHGKTLDPMTVGRILDDIDVDRSRKRFVQHNKATEIPESMLPTCKTCKKPMKRAGHTRHGHQVWLCCKKHHVIHGWTCLSDRCKGPQPKQEK